jgi:Methyltransferase domain
MKNFLNSLFAVINSRNTINISDDFTYRLKQVVPGMLEPGNLHLFEYAIKNLPTSDPILEIGAFMGLSTNLIAYYKVKNKKVNRFITCDKWDYSFKGLSDEKLGSSNITGKEWGDYVKQSFLRNISFFSKGDLPVVVHEYSNSFFERWNCKENYKSLLGEEFQLGGLFSFCFIDGNHDYEFVKEDFLHCDAHLVKNGFIMFDDSSRFRGSPGVKRLMKELKENNTFGNKYEIVSMNPNYLIKKL